VNLTDRLPEVAVYVVHLEDPPGSGRAACSGLLLPRLPEVGIRWGCSGCLRLAATPAPHSIGGVLHNHRHSERPDCGERVVGDCLTATPVPLDVTPEAAVMGTDARLWASEFVRLFGNDPDEGTMLGWFANAIEAGRDATPAPLAPHPGEHHDYRMACLSCGEPGHLFVGFHSPGETFRWSEAQPKEADR